MAVSHFSLPCFSLQTVQNFCHSCFRKCHSIPVMRLGWPSDGSTGGSAVCFAGAITGQAGSKGATSGTTSGNISGLFLASDLSCHVYNPCMSLADAWVIEGKKRWCQLQILQHCPSHCVLA